jgi:L-aspartate oxidase
MEDGRVAGVITIDAQGARRPIRARAVLLATGGTGQIYRDTTNPAVATGDGVAMAYRAGAEISDLEFVQFHPTALFVKGAPRFLLSEALRGEGAYLRNAELVRFMPKYHPLAELAPRDVVARAIAHELEVSNSPDPAVYLDMTHLARKRLDQRFPRIHETCLRYNLDIRDDLVPVRPAAHYAMGGVRTDLDGRTTLPGLYAAGEVACTGVHGANRLASNSLLEGLVYGARAAQAMRAERTRPPAASSANARAAVAGNSPTDARTPDADPASPSVENAIQKVQDLMWQDVGIVRSAAGLRRAIERLEQLLPCLQADATRRGVEARNIHQVALLIARSALARRESRGAHYRTDYPAHDDAHFARHSVICGAAIRFE